MNEAYAALEGIWKRHFTEEFVDIEKVILGLLLQKGINIRKQDGDLMRVTVSIPTSVDDAFVIGLRYIKKDRTCTEDHFLCRKDVDPSIEQLQIEPHYKSKLEFRLPEYSGTHKQQENFTWVDAKDIPPTQVNTISYLTYKK